MPGQPGLWQDGQLCQHACRRIPLLRQNTHSLLQTPPETRKSFLAGAVRSLCLTVSLTVLPTPLSTCFHPSPFNLYVSVFVVLYLFVTASLSHLVFSFYVHFVVTACLYLIYGSNGCTCHAVILFNV